VLILREVLAWSAQETAELLGLTVASVNSALQRARATISSVDLTGDRLEPLDKEQSDLLTRYVAAFEAYDMASLASLLHDDATLSMPPLKFWFRGHEDIREFMVGPGAPCRGSRLVPTVANGLPAFGQYRPSGPGGRHEPWALIILEISGDKIAGINSFLDVDRVFPLFGLPPHLDDLN
jgi:RNA polymerase sigma-70 factor (ECF subfamily)